MSTSAHDVAAALEARLGALGKIKLHKLLYYAQGWHLAWTGEPLFTESIEAWAKGPVVATLWRDQAHGRDHAAPKPVDDDAATTITYVVDRYGGLTGADLIRQTHNEAPWRDVTENDDPFMVDEEITHGALLDWFRRDREYLAYTDEVARERERSIYGFATGLRSDVDGIIERARKEPFQDSRPA